MCNRWQQNSCSDYPTFYKMKSEVAVLIVIFSSLLASILGDDESELFQTNDLDCWYKPSCNLTQNSNTSLIPFVPGCKCDVDCVKHDDCCKDSKYYGEVAIKTGREYTCHPKLEVYVVSSCPQSYPNENVARNCSFELPIKDVAFVVPVTNKRTRTTYANKYCALCHNDTQYTAWDLLVGFVEVTSAFFEGEYAESAQQDSLFAAQDDDPVAEELLVDSAAEQNSEYLAKNGAFGRLQADQLFSSVRFYPAHESFLAASSDGKRFVCTFEPKMPAEMAAFARKCLPNLVAECPDDGEKNDICRSYTEIVYDRYNALAFRNKDCAECNSVLPDDSSFCPQIEIPAAADQRHGFVISARNKTSNRNLCNNPILPRFFCPAKKN